MSILRHPTVRKHAPQLMKFALAGGIGASIDLGSLTFFIEALGMEKRLAVVPSTLLSVTVVFFLNKFITFKNKDRKKMGAQAFKFAIVYGVAIVSNIIISASLITLGVHYLLAKIAAIAVGAFWNYAMSHGFVFKKNEPGAQEVVII